jgi:hypothetical protein
MRIPDRSNQAGGRPCTTPVSRSRFPLAVRYGSGRLDLVQQPAHCIRDDGSDPGRLEAVIGSLHCRHVDVGRELSRPPERVTAALDDAKRDGHREFRHPAPIRASRRMQWEGERDNGTDSKGGRRPAGHSSAAAPPGHEQRKRSAAGNPASCPDRLSCRRPSTVELGGWGGCPPARDAVGLPHPHYRDAGGNGGVAQEYEVRRAQVTTGSVPRHQDRAGLAHRPQDDALRDADGRRDLGRDRFPQRRQG